VDYAVATGPSSVAVGDFNHDGKADLVTTNKHGNSVSVLPGNGDGTFKAHVDYKTANGPLFVAVGDFRGDGNSDLAVADAAGVSVLLGNPDGTFQKHVNYAVVGGTTFVALADVNGDGKLDLLATDNTNDGVIGEVSVLLGNGDGTFQAPVEYSVADTPISVVAADFNQDGAPDLAIANFWTGNVNILLNSGGSKVKEMSSPDPSTIGQNVTFECSVIASFKDQPTPTGTVTFTDGNSKLATVTLQQGRGQFETSTLSVGTHTITASYSGDSHFNPNTAQAIVQTVKK
jgi:hypothetical protein